MRMVRTSKMAQLTPQQEARVHDIMRQHRYANTSIVRVKLAEMGVEMSRATVHRSMQRLQRSYANSVLVVIIDRRTGATTSVSTGAQVPDILSAIAALSA